MYNTLANPLVTWSQAHSIRVSLTGRCLLKGKISLVMLQTERQSAFPLETLQRGKRSALFPNI